MILHTSDVSEHEIVSASCVLITPCFLFESIVCSNFAKDLFGACGKENSKKILRIVVNFSQYFPFFITLPILFCFPRVPD